MRFHNFRIAPRTDTQNMTRDEMRVSAIKFALGGVAGILLVAFALSLARASDWFFGGPFEIVDGALELPGLIFAVAGLLLLTSVICGLASVILFAHIVFRSDSRDDEIRRRRSRQVQSE